jgi:ubiquinone/menaquinone biosynthesis C-methylase UbiE
MSILALSVWLAVAAGAYAQEAHEQQGHRPDQQRFTDVERWVQRFEDPARREWQSPHTILRLMGLSEGDEVADIGTGTGYFLPWLSAMVTETGRVYAVDIEQEMLDYIEQREDLPHDNVRTILADPDDPKLPEGRLDAILIVNTWHHIAKRVKYLEKLEKALRPDGRVVIVDYLKRELPVGPPPDHKLSREEVLADFEKAGWTFEGESVALRYQYYLTFTPRGGR